MSKTERGHPIPVLVLAILAISTSGVMVRLAPEVPPPSLALWRVLIVGLLMAPVAALERPRLSRRDQLLVGLAGLLLALHFWSWFASLHHTTVMRSTVLVCLTPVWTGLMEWGLLRSPPPPRFWPGVILALAGVAVMGGIGAGGSVSLLGDGLALIGGVLSGAYLVVGRAVRPRVSIGSYGAMLCLACAAWLLAIALATGTPLLGFSPTAWLVIAGLALGPQLFGHIGMNYAVRYVSASLIAALILFEPVGATVLGAAVLGEWPTLWELAGGLLILVGLGVVTIAPAPAQSA